ncbi:hypothetical protein IC620_16080 [Hazenella sp. IB182357]|uniref:Uncharacterized protein n=1 Tax=Polycladospora coralii TaxID=2771432 RepID=A0A926NIG4_9BACL|nr:hypothetical protein [Polycladospora coralii]MBD1373863.1 hypothetical protein [Polycladospora coralii]
MKKLVMVTSIALTVLFSNVVSANALPSHNLKGSSDSLLLAGCIAGFQHHCDRNQV